MQMCWNIWITILLNKHIFWKLACKSLVSKLLSNQTNKIILIAKFDTLAMRVIKSSWLRKYTVSAIIKQC